jgi:hypothetical protein
MPTYVYEILDDKGQPTGETFEYIQSIKADALTSEPNTNRPVRRAIVSPNFIIDAKKPKTIGALADKNTSEMLKRGDSRIQKKKDANPWWRPSKKKPVDIRGWSKKKIKGYIETGKQ